jgi:hypothetical protein
MELYRAFCSELSAINFAFIPSEKLKYFDLYTEYSLLDDIISHHFPEAHKDIKGAGVALAADLHDAAAFYLMRVVEVGLRDLARNLGIKKLKNNPLDYGGWDDVVKAIDDKLSKKIPKSRSPKKIAAMKFKQAMLLDFKHFQVLRNEIMHGRSRHNEQEAVGLFNRVNEFMQRLDTIYEEN